MGSHILSAEDGELFFLSRALIADYTQQELGIEGYLFYDEPGSPNINEPLFREVLEEFYERPEFALEMGRTAPPGSDPELTAALMDWQFAYSNRFIAFEYEGRAVFYHESRLFDVKGLTRPINEMLDFGTGDLLLVGTALLPFGSQVVYDGFLVQADVHIGEGMAAIIRKEIDDALREDKWVRTAKEFREIVPRIREERREREAKEFAKDIENYEKSEVPQTGSHRGILANLSNEERDRRVHDSIHELVAGMEHPIFRLGREDYIEHPVCETLPEILALVDKNMLKAIVRALNVDVDQEEQTEVVIEAISRELPHKDEVLREAIGEMEPGESATLRLVAEAGGVMSYEPGEEPDVPLDFQLSCLCFAFEHAGQVSLVVPRELREFVLSVDLEGARLQSRIDSAIADTVEALCELRGIVSLPDAYEEYCRLYDTVIDLDQFTLRIRSMIERIVIAEGLFEAPDETYVLELNLALDWFDENNIKPNLREPLFLEGDLGFIKRILKMREGKNPRHLGPELLTPVDVYDLKSTTPAALAFRDYLDANVPDSRDDVLYADKVIEDIIDCFSVGLTGTEGFRLIFEILEDNDYIPDEAHLKRIGDLAMDMINSIPTYTNNGWSPLELAGQAAFSSGRRVFYNEDGTVKRVGRNDPCPCGSGKKYKRCCGRGGR